MQFTLDKLYRYEREIRDILQDVKVSDWEKIQKLILIEHQIMNLEEKIEEVIKIEERL